MITVDITNPESPYPKWYTIKAYGHHIATLNQDDLIMLKNECEQALNQACPRSSALGLEARQPVLTPNTKDQNPRT